eukprot:TRINITY_DN31600_c0_g1_i1.p1 TRINITY_DN31600_c0_g1~~TRINITY_DN31600_c0_g1_i1.p1  ORF type:complete len:365 (+),score=46.04 TRINITY_DN31600_c0_g1_i1:56-1150(+)
MNSAFALSVLALNVLIQKSNGQNTTDSPPGGDLPEGGLIFAIVVGVLVFICGAAAVMWQYKALDRAKTREEEQLVKATAQHLADYQKGEERLQILIEEKQAAGVIPVPPSPNSPLGSSFKGRGRRISYGEVSRTSGGTTFSFNMAQGGSSGDSIVAAHAVRRPNPLTNVCRPKRQRSSSTVAQSLNDATPTSQKQLQLRSSSTLAQTFTSLSVTSPDGTSTPAPVPRQRSSTIATIASTPKAMSQTFTSLNVSNPPKVRRQRSSTVASPKGGVRRQGDERVSKRHRSSSSLAQLLMGDDDASFDAYLASPMLVKHSPPPSPKRCAHCSARSATLMCQMCGRMCSSCYKAKHPPHLQTGHIAVPI